MLEVRRSGAFRFGALLCLFFSLGLGTSAQAQTVEAVGLRVVGPGMGRNGSELRAFNQSPGLTVALGFQVPEGMQLVEIDDDSCTLEALTQADGTSLLEDVDWGPFPDISEDGRAGMIEFSSGRRPSAGTQSLRARGTLVLRVARNSKSGPAQGFAAKVGTEFSAAGGDFLVQVAGEDEEYGGYRLVLETLADTADRISEFQFKDAEGQAVETNGRGSMTMGSRTQLEFYIEGSKVPVALDLVWFDGLETLDLPFDLEIQLSLGGSS